MSINYNYSIELARSQDFPNLRDTVYVDHVGATLYSRSQMEAVHKDLMSNLYGNPHSHNASSKLSTDTVDQVRARILQMFNTNHKEYSLIFTSGCTASLQIIANCFRFGTGNHTCLLLNNVTQIAECLFLIFVILRILRKEKKNYLFLDAQQGVFCYLDDNHTSVQGMREAVADRTSGIFCLDEQELVQAICGAESSSPVAESSVDPESINGEATLPPTVPQSLVAFPAQSNFSGRKYPLEWVLRCKQSGLSVPSRKSSESEKWFVLLDTAAYVSTSPLDLSRVQPDFATVSFYKMFGYPTGIGALLVHKRAWSSLDKQYFGGGTVAASTSKGRFHAFWKSLHDRFEDGTVPFLNIISLKHGMDAMQKLAGNMQVVCDHVFAVARYFYQHLSKLQHGNGQPLAEIYGGVNFETSCSQGGVVTFNILRSDGAYIGYSEVDKFANLHDVHLRTGCFCNIGACQRFLSLSDKVIKENFDAGHVCGDNMDLIAGRPTGAVRISFGYMSTIDDARVCLRFIADSFLEKPVTIPAFPNPDCPSNDSGPKVRKLTDIHLYPLKSCGAFKVSEWEMGSKGLLYDREWVLVTDAGVTIGQKKIPQICMLRPHIDLESRRFTLNFPGKSDFL
ncbi:hypothetical protein EGW08_021094 [Elysia chlorotica]|uniref:Molybdenum cofactor sulfurase n=1 Tax=Elysia chlorotica TaxID=188477 RepID=A0A3S1AZF2_ELYCH|nr:hypothetical protein EGW08_021094 [Elysia chlorotica]